MILFLGDSFTWGQGLYYEKWDKDGVDVGKWQRINGLISEFPHENLDYESHQYRKQQHFPSLVAKHYNKNYDVKWGNGGSNWDIIVQINMIPVFAPQFRDGLDLVVVQLTDWIRNDNRDFFVKDLHKNAIVDTKYLSNKTEWETKVTNSMMEEEMVYQLKKINQYLKNLDKKWIAISWLDDIGESLKKHFPKNYTPIYHNDKEYPSFESLTYDENYSLIEKYADGHLNSQGHRVVANSIIKKIDSMGGKTLFTYPKSQNII